VLLIKRVLAFNLKIQIFAFVSAVVLSCVPQQKKKLLRGKNSDPKDAQKTINHFQGSFSVIYAELFLCALK